MRARRCGSGSASPHTALPLQPRHTATTQLPDALPLQVIYKIDIPANRYDMLCLEGIARALNIFRGRMAPPAYRLADMAGRQMLRMVVRRRRRSDSGGLAVEER